MHLSDPSGYIASIITEKTTCGSGGSPWIITAKPGQKINFTLLDFGVAVENPTPAPNKMKSAPVFCEQYAVIAEPSAGRSTIVCGGHFREKHVYKTVTNEVRVHILSRKQPMHPAKHFVLHYEGKLKLFICS